MMLFIVSQHEKICLFYEHNWNANFWTWNELLLWRKLQDTNMTSQSNGACTFDLCWNDALPAEMLALWGLVQEGCRSHPLCACVRLQIPVGYQRMTAVVPRKTEVQMCVTLSITRSVCLQQLQSILGARGGGGERPPPPHSPSLSVSLSWLAAARPSWLPSVRQRQREREVEGDGGFSDGVSCHFLFLYSQSVHL